MLHAEMGENGTDATALRRRHLRFGWTALLVFAAGGVVLEVLHGFKVAWYLDVANETRRHLLTLAHAHGVLLALVNLAFGFTLPELAARSPRALRWASNGLLAAAVLMPAGFFLGALQIFAGDPGAGIVLLPLGAVALLAALALVASAVRGR